MDGKAKARIKRRLKTHGELPCSFCRPPECCNYVAVQIGTPRSKADFDDMLWHVSHEGVEYFVDSGKWYLLFHTRCSHLDSEGRCAIYEERFRVCREHPADRCEFWGGKFDLHFRTYEDLKTYADARWRRLSRNAGKAWAIRRRKRMK
jgi:Fe-S-cluster containining protein